MYITYVVVLPPPTEIGATDLSAIKGRGEFRGGESSTRISAISKYIQRIEILKIQEQNNENFFKCQEADSKGNRARGERGKRHYVHTRKSQARIWVLWDQRRNPFAFFDVED